MSVWQTVSSASSSASVGGELRGRPSTSARNCASATVPKWPPRLKLPLKPGASAGSSSRAPSAQQDLAHLSATRTSLRVWRSSTRTPDAHAVRTLYAGNVHQTRTGAVQQTKFLLEESQLPGAWYNIRADMPTAPQPVLHPGTGQPVGPDDLAPLFPMELIGQEVSEDAEIPIPEEVLDIYALWRPTPLFRAHRLEQAIGTRSRIFYKYEGGSPPGSHQPNTAVAQAFYNKKEGRTRLATETGAGQWGGALPFACKLIGLECKVYMVRISYDQKPARRS